MFFIEEYEAEPALAGDYEEVTKKVVRQRKVSWSSLDSSLN